MGRRYSSPVRETFQLFADMNTRFAFKLLVMDCEGSASLMPCCNNSAFASDVVLGNGTLLLHSVDESTERFGVLGDKGFRSFHF